MCLTYSCSMRGGSQVISASSSPLRMRSACPPKCARMRSCPRSVSCSHTRNVQPSTGHVHAASFFAVWPGSGSKATRCRTGLQSTAATPAVFVVAAAVTAVAAAAAVVVVVVVVVVVAANDAGPVAGMTVAVAGATFRVTAMAGAAAAVAVVVTVAAAAGAFVVAAGNSAADGAVAR